MARMTHSSDRLSVSVVVPVYNGGESFRRCLSALAGAEPPPDEIVVVVDGATDDSAQWAQAHGVRVTRTPTRSGPAHARNLGASLARGDILFFVDADVLIRPDAIGQLAGLFRGDPDLTAVFGSYDDAPAATNFLSQYKNLFHHYVHQTAREEASTFFGACGAIRRDIFLDLGGYDRCYRKPAIEDIELGYRLKEAGHQIRLCKTLQVKHLKRWDILSLLRADFLQRAVPWTELILRDRRFINDLNLRYASRLSVILTFGLLAALIGACFWPGLLVFAGVAILLLLALNAPLYRFFQRKRGLWFALQAISWHWLYYLYSGLAFFVGMIRYAFSGLRTGKQRLPKPQNRV
jgi:glycosyltransferase involved in cell wall biosynthesis